MALGPMGPPLNAAMVRAQKGEFWCILGATFAVELDGNWIGYCLVSFGEHKTRRPPSRKIFQFLSSKGEFRCIFATFAVELNGNWLGY